MESLFVAMKWACLGNAIFMLLWMEYRNIHTHSFSWILLDALIVVLSLQIAMRYHEDGY